jgi:transposase-like protein
MITSRSTSSSAPVGYRFPREVIAVAVRWYLRYGLSYRDVEELLAERGITVDHVTIYRWVQTFTKEFIDAARPARHATGDRWFLDETYVKVAARWTYLYRAIDQHDQVIDVLVSQRRDAVAARAFFARALTRGPSPTEVTTDRAPVYPRLIDELTPAARHVLEQYANNRIEADHGRLKARLRPMRGLKTTRSLRRSRAATPLCRTCAADTTNSPPTCPHALALSPYSPNLPAVCDRASRPTGQSPATRSINATVPLNQVDVDRPLASRWWRRLPGASLAAAISDGHAAGTWRGVRDAEGPGSRPTSPGHSHATAA